MAQSSCVVSLPQMVDLALNAPEIGAVNFNILHSLLHVIVQQLELTDCNVEFRGPTSDKMQNVIATSKPSPTLNLTEYVVTPGKDAGKVVSKKRKYKRTKRPSIDGTAKKRSKEEIVTETEVSPVPSSSSFQTVVVIEPTDQGISTPHVSVAVPKSLIDDLENDIKEVKEQIRELAELPANSGLIDAVRAGADKSSPVLDMFQILNLTKRLDGAEAGMNKLASMIEDLAREAPTQNSQHILSKAGELRSSITKQTGGLASKTLIPADRIQEIEERISSLEAALGVKKPSSTDVKKTEKKASVQSVEDSIIEEKESKPAKATQPKKRAERADDDSNIDEDLSLIKEELAELKQKLKGLDSVLETFTGEHLVEALQDLDELREKLLTKGSAKGSLGGETSEAMNLPPDLRLNEMENRFATYTAQIKSLDTMFNNQLNMLQSQVGDLEREIGGLVETINAGLPAGDASGVADQSVGELYAKLITLQSDMDHMAETANKLLDDKDDKQKHMDSMLEQIELLKTIKADKEDIHDALADKADACAVNRKVSHDQFDAACDDLSRGIEDALSKLTQQETLWQQALDDIQREIGNKLDKMELTPLRDFVNKKLKALQERLKALAAMKQDQEAAGTKSKLLRNVNCISCDKDVIMRTEMDPSLLPKPIALPPARSMGPYLAYELDALRKQQKSVPGSRNLHHFENAIYGGKTPREEDHICNRYCGGSHTTTTPQQRVTRLGHFLNQWGTEQEPVQEGQIRGTDGQYYKSRDMGDGPPGKSEESSNQNIPTEQQSEKSQSISVQPSAVAEQPQAPTDEAPQQDTPSLKGKRASSESISSAAKEKKKADNKISFAGGSKTSIDY